MVSYLKRSFVTDMHMYAYIRVSEAKYGFNFIGTTRIGSRFHGNAGSTNIATRYDSLIATMQLKLAY